jgi:ABC-type lipoprotein export system ATPase subunit
MNKIKIIELTKNYQSNKQNQLVLDNLNAEINLTGLTSLQGKSGSGKSTLMHILSGRDILSIFEPVGVYSVLRWGIRVPGVVSA